MFVFFWLLCFSSYTGYRHTLKFLKISNNFAHVDATDALLIGNSSIAASHKTLSCSDRSQFSLPQPPPTLAQCQQSRVNQRSKTIEKKWNNKKNNTTQQSFHRQLIWVAKSHALNSAHWLDSIFFLYFSSLSFSEAYAGSEDGKMWRPPSWLSFFFRFHSVLLFCFGIRRRCRWCRSPCLCLWLGWAVRYRKAIYDWTASEIQHRARRTMKTTTKEHGEELRKKWNEHVDDKLK